LLLLNILSDFNYFWRNNFRSNLKKIIIGRNKSSLSILSIRQIKDYCMRYSNAKIKSVFCNESVRAFRERFTVIQNIQYLLFGQFVREGNNAFNTMIGLPRVNIGRMKTTNLKQYSEKVKEMSNQQDQINKSKSDINQFNQIKMVLLNFSFNDNGRKTLCVDIIANVLDELRRERKIKMVLADAEIEEYIKLDLSNANPDDPDMTDFKRKTLMEKKVFKEDVTQKVSIIRLGYMFKVLKAVHPGKASMLGAEAFQTKVKKAESSKNKKRNRFLGQQSGVSGIFGKSSAGGSMVMEGKGNQKNVEDQITDPVLSGINKFIHSMMDMIVEAGTAKLKVFEGLYKQFKTEAPMDTVEENIKDIEKKRRM